MPSKKDTDITDFIDDLDLPETDKYTEKRTITRKNSLRVQARWYRSPEIILQTQDYDEKIDMWGVGCILTQIVEKIINDDKKLAVFSPFKGTSCFPLSPVVQHGSGEATIDSKD